MAADKQLAKVYEHLNHLKGGRRQDRGIPLLYLQAKYLLEALEDFYAELHATNSTSNNRELDKLENDVLWFAESLRESFDTVSQTVAALNDDFETLVREINI